MSHTRLMSRYRAVMVPHTMFTEEEEFIFLLLLLDSGLFYVLISVSRWILLRCNRRMKILMAMLTGPINIMRFWPQQRLIASGGMSFDLFSKSDDWCLEFLRFTKKQICEMTYLLDGESSERGLEGTTSPQSNVVWFLL
jgi:hypothetical protein